MPGLRSSEPIESGFLAILFALGNHDWLSAVGWDVVLSTFSLCAWAIVSRADVRGMIKCGLWPWLDESFEALHEGAEVCIENLDPYLEAMQENVERLQEKAKPYAKDLRKRTKRAMRNAEPYLETARDSADEILDHGSKYAKNAYSKAAERYGVGGDHDNGGDSAESGAESEEILPSPKKLGRPAKGTRKASKSPGPTRKSVSRQARDTSSTRERASERQASRPRRRSSRIKSLTSGNSRLSSDGEPWYRTFQVPQQFVEWAEIVGMAWALFLIGGLGLASTSVYGADETREEEKKAGGRY